MSFSFVNIPLFAYLNVARLFCGFSSNDVLRNVVFVLPGELHVGKIGDNKA